MRRALLLIYLLAVAALTGCHGETAFPQATGKGSVRAINAIKTAPDVSFLIEERSAGSLVYGVPSAGAQYDDLSYVFNFEAVLAGNTTRTRVASLPLDVVKDTDYTFVMTGQLANPTITLWERPSPDFDTGATNFEAQVGHLSAALGDVDVYLADPATAPAIGNELGTLTFGEVLPVSSLAGGDYVLTLTAVGDPATVLFQSNTANFAAGSAVLMNAFDGAGVDTVPTVVNTTDLTSGATTRLAASGRPTTMRFFHAAFDLGIADIYADDPLTTPILEDHAFGDVSTDIDVATGSLPITYTTANDVGSVLVDTEINTTAGRRNYVLLVEDGDGAGQTIPYIPNLRSVESQIKLGIAHTAAATTPVDVYIVPSGESIDEVNPALNGLGFGFAPVVIPLGAAGDFDIHITGDEDKIPLTDPLAGQLTINVAFGDVLQIIIRETAVAGVLDVAVIPLP
jgi:hypothetical protein